MEHPNHIDDLLRQRLYDAEVAPPAFVWPEVERALRKRRRRFLFFFFTTGGLAMALAAGWFYRVHNGAIAALQPALVSESGAARQGMPTASVTAVETPTAQEIPTASVTSAATPATTHTSGGSPTLNTKTTLTGREEARNVTPKSAGLAHPKAASLPPVAREATQATLARIASSNVQSDPEQPVAGASVAEAIPAPPAARASEPGMKKSALPMLGLNTLPATVQLISASKNGTGRLPVVMQVKKFGQYKKQPKVCYDFERHPNVWFIDVYGGPSFASKEMKTDNTDVNQNYLKQRLATEKKDWAFNTGLRGTLLFNQHYMLRAGVQYEQMTEVFQLTKPNTITVDIERRWDPAVGVWVEDTIGVRFGEKFYKIYNRFGMLDIPVQVGVEMRNGRSGFSINGGFTVNVLFWKRGAIDTDNAVPRYFTPGSPNSYEIFKASTGISATCSVQWFYHIQPSLRIFAEPYFRQILQPVTVPGYPIGQRYGIGGIRLGVTKILD
jgi:hypothetical protein